MECERVNFKQVYFWLHRQASSPIHSEKELLCLLCFFFGSKTESTQADNLRALSCVLHHKSPSHPVTLCLSLSGIDLSTVTDCNVALSLIFCRHSDDRSCLTIRPSLKITRVYETSSIRIIRQKLTDECLRWRRQRLFVNTAITIHSFLPTWKT